MIWFENSQVVTTNNYNTLNITVIITHKFFDVCLLVVAGEGRAIAQAVSHRLPTPAAWVGARVRTYGICGGQSGTGADFLRLLQFSLPIRIPPTAHMHHLSSGAGTVGQLVAVVPSGLSLTPRKKISVLWRVDPPPLEEVCKIKNLRFIRKGNRPEGLIRRRRGRGRGKWNPNVSSVECV
jgi:hypothetical protein